MRIVHFEQLPWFLRLYLHTMQFRLNGEPFDRPGGSRTHYLPAINRERPSQLEMSLLIPPGAVLSMSLMFEKPLLRYTEYPFDPSRGFDVK